MTARLQDIEVVLADRPGSLAAFGETPPTGRGQPGGRRSFTIDSQAVAHFLVDDAARAHQALEVAGIAPVTIHDVIMLRLRQAVPGQLGLLAARMAEAGVNIAVQYSDHDHHLVLVVSAEHTTAAQKVADTWSAQRQTKVCVA